MSKETPHYEEEIKIALATLGLFFISSMWAFSRKTRMEIGRRDKWTCVDCGKQFKDGNMVHAAHNPEHHQKSDPMYDDVSSGDIRCIDCHQKQHEKGTNLGIYGDRRAVQLLKATDRKTKR